MQNSNFAFTKKKNKLKQPNERKLRKKIANDNNSNTTNTKKITKINKSCTKDLKEKYLMVFVAVAANVYANVLKTTRNEKNNNNNKNFLWNRTKIACKVFLKKWKK